jgi:hypothetical protein
MLLASRLGLSLGYGVSLSWLYGLSVIMLDLVTGKMVPPEHVFLSTILSIYIICDSIYAAFTSIVWKLIEYRNYHVVAAQSTQIYGDIRMGAGLLKRLKNALGSKQKVDQVAHSAPWFELHSRDIVYSNGSNLDERFELCMEKRSENMIQFTYSLPRSLLLTLADQQSKKARIGLHLRSVNPIQPPTKTNVRKKRPTKEQQITTLVSLDICGEFGLQKSDIRIFVNGEVRLDAEILLTKQLIKLRNLTPDEQYSIHVEILGFSSTKLYCRTTPHDGSSSFLE